MAKLNKIDSNITGLRYCQEASLGVLPIAASQVWKPMEPNSYKDFGGKVTTVARRPINPSRQRKKGVVTDIEAKGGIATDITQTNLQDLLQGFFFADLRRKTEEVGWTSVTSGTKKYARAASAILAGDLVFGSGFGQSANNGLKTVTAVSGTDITVAETVVTEVPSLTAAQLTRVGFQFAAGDATIVTTGSLPALVVTAKNLTQLGVIPGEWVFIGGDTVATKFATAADNGFARVRSVTATTITFDKTAGTMVADAGAAKTIQIFVGRVLKNEQGTLIKRRSYTLERTLGSNNDTDLTKQQADYLIGSIPDSFSLLAPAANKVTADISFMSLRETALDENDGTSVLLTKVGGVTTPALVESDAFNTSTDLSRVKLSTWVDGAPNPTPLFAFVSDITLDIKNNLKADKALGVTGAFEVSAGMFEVGGKLTAYFSDIAAINAVQNNKDITMDVHFVKSNSGISIDLPMITLGDGLPKIQQDQAIELPLTMEAATGGKIDPNLDYTMLMVFWDYLPTLAHS